MNQEIVKHKTPWEILGIAAPTWETLSPISQGWLTQASKRVILFENMTRDETAVQNQLLPVMPLLTIADGLTVEKMNENLTKAKSLLAKAKELAATSKAERISFTSSITEMLFTPAMAFEKRNDERIAAASKLELDYRTATEKKNNETFAMANELAALRVHIVNEYNRIGLQYRSDLAKHIQDAYSTALRGKTPVDTIDAYKEQVVSFMKQITLSPFVRFNRLHVSDADAQKLFGEITPYNSANDFNDAIKSLNEKFAMYEHDLANAEAAIAASEKQLNEQIAEEQQNAAIEAATNTLMANTGTIQSSGGAKVKRTMDVVVENTESWETAVLSSYIKNFVDCQQFIKAAERANRKLSQYATALGKLATKRGQTDTTPGAVYPGLTLIEIKK